MSSTFERKLAAIMFTDIAEFTALSGQDEQKALGLIDQLKSITSPLIKEFKGTLHKELGDGFLYSFNTVTDSIRCAIKIQKSIKGIEDLNLRIGLHEGEVNVKGSDILGDDVNIASRIVGSSPIGGIALSGKVQQNISSLPEFEATYIGSPQFKGVAKVVEIYCITSHGLPKGDKTKITSKLEKKKFSFVKKIVFPLTGLILTLIGAAFWLIYPFISIAISEDDMNYTNYDSSIAILYFENRGSPDTDYIANGLTDELITRLSRIKKLRVAPRMDVAYYKNKQVKIDQIAKELKVDYIVSGSVSVINEKIRVNLELANTATKEIVWSDNISNNLTDIFKVQDDIAEHITSNIDILFSYTDLMDVQKRPTNNFEAYKLVLQASDLHFGTKAAASEAEFVLKATPLIEKAIKLDSTYADALAYLGLTKLIGFRQQENTAYDKDKYNNDLNLGLELANKALMYDPKHQLGLALNISIPFSLLGDRTSFDFSESAFIDDIIFTYRNVAVTVKKMAQEYPNSPYSKTMVGLYYWARSFAPAIISSEDDLQKATKLMEGAWDEVKDVNSSQSADTYAYAAHHILKGMLPQFWNSKGEFDKTVELITNYNKCDDGTYNCLSIGQLDDRIYLLYAANAYKEVLKVGDAIFNMTKKDFEVQMEDQSIKMHPYYLVAKIYLKLADYNKAEEYFIKSISYDRNILRQNINRPHLNDEDLKQYLGLTYYLAGEYDKALTTFLAAKDITDENEEKFIMQLNTMIASSQLKLGNIDIAKKEFLIVQNWFDKLDMSSYGQEEVFSYYVGYYLFQLNEYFGNNKEARIVLEKAYNTTNIPILKKYLVFKKANNHDKFELAIYFWVKDIADNYHK